jgi:hypothetical protein
MTTSFNLDQAWSGQTVAILAAGPSMSQAVADAMRQHRCIALNHTVALAPWADLFLALDPGVTFLAQAPDFAGIKVCGINDPDTDALYAGLMYERVDIGPAHQVEIRNNGLAAIRIAVRMGAAKIILCGFDPQEYGYYTGELSELEQAYMSTVEGETYPGLTAGLQAITAELQAAGIVVERYMPEQAEPPKAEKRKNKAA